MIRTLATAAGCLTLALGCSGDTILGHGSAAVDGAGTGGSAEAAGGSAGRGANAAGGSGGTMLLTVGGNSGDAGAGGSLGGGGGIPACVQVEGPCAADDIRRDPWEVLLDAATYDPGARLVAMGAWGVLIQDGNGSWRIAYSHTGFDAWPEEPLAELGFADEPARVIDVTFNAIDRSNVVFALGCDADSTHCRLYRGDAAAEQPVMEEWPGATLPEGVLARGIVYDRYTDSVCAFGNALVCFGEEWQTVVPLEGNVDLREVLIAQPSSLAVAADGRWWRRISTTWTEQEPLTSELRGAAWFQDQVALVGAEYLWVLDGMEITQCELPSGEPDVSGWDIVDLQSGRTLSGLPSFTSQSEATWCEIDPAPLTDEAIDAEQGVSCGFGSDVRILTASQLLGRNWCFLID